MPTRRLIAAMLVGLAVAGASAGGAPPLPATLQNTGLQHRDTLAFAPQYVLWSDGADKRRWIRLPHRAAIDGADPDAWKFPPGTRLWKEFSVAGRKVETRFIERLADGRWRFAAYAWNADGSEARLVPAGGAVLTGIDGAPGSRWDIPSRDDCVACHGGAVVPVLGVAALQLSPDRDPLAPQRGAAGGIDLQQLIARRLLRNYNAASAPRISAASPEERTALGVLHANCGHCHNASGNRVPVPLRLAQSVAEPARVAADVLRSAVEVPSRRRGAPVIVPGHPAESLLVQRMASRDPRTQMPPLGTRLPDAAGLALVERWISRQPPTQENTP